mmetsp:Transcript_79327/g.214818  ORF Transcript_79327/g.214818 Transcript_79327/m.214818 type:complete len:233 (-) Transcript_79327:1498-2196(-)
MVQGTPRPTSPRTAAPPTTEPSAASACAQWTVASPEASASGRDVPIATTEAARNLGSTPSVQPSSLVRSPTAAARTAATSRAHRRRGQPPQSPAGGTHESSSFQGSATACSSRSRGLASTSPSLPPIGKAASQNCCDQFCAPADTLPQSSLRWPQMLSSCLCCSSEADMLTRHTQASAPPAVSASKRAPPDASSRTSWKSSVTPQRPFGRISSLILAEAWPSWNSRVPDFST